MEQLKMPPEELFPKDQKVGEPEVKEKKSFASSMSEEDWKALEEPKDGDQMFMRK